MQLLNALLKEKTDSLFWDCILKDKSYLVLQNNRQMLHILRYFILLFKNNTDKMIHKGCYLRKIEKKKIVMLGLMVEDFLINMLKTIQKHVKKLQQLLLVREMITQLTF